jgi:hypothetical protein
MARSLMLAKNLVYLAVQFRPCEKKGIKLVFIVTAVKTSNLNKTGHVFEKLLWKPD